MKELDFFFFFVRVFQIRLFCFVQKVPTLTSFLWDLVLKINLIMFLKIIIVEAKICRDTEDDPRGRLGSRLVTSGAPAKQVGHSDGQVSNNLSSTDQC